MIQLKSILNSIIQENKLKNFNDILAWITDLNLDIRQPKGLKKEFALLKYAKSKAQSLSTFTNKEYIASVKKEILRVYDDLTDEQIERFNNKNETTIKTKYATYYKQDASAYAKFKAAIVDIDSFLATLKGYHATALKNLHIVFGKKSDIKSKAKYKSDKDKIYINLQSMGKTNEEYGSLKYVLLHELGHRYLAFNNQRWNYDAVEWLTTKYSGVDSWSGEEKFAELFAISHWPSKYSQYKDKISKFKNQIK
jgi:hypothetical protein